MSCQESQQEECEVLRAIYEGDERFKEISPTSFQYKIGDESDAKTFLVEVSWPDTYPNELPTISLDAFYNKLIPADVKSSVISALTGQAELLLGAAMTYTLFEYAKENVEELMVSHSSSTKQQSCDVETSDSKQSAMSSDAAQVGKTKEKKEQLTKAQKRKLVGRQDEKGEMARGWNWVDVVKHLCQTGRSDMLGDS